MDGGGSRIRRRTCGYSDDIGAGSSAMTMIDALLFHRVTPYDFYVSLFDIHHDLSSFHILTLSYVS